MQNLIDDFGLYSFCEQYILLKEIYFMLSLLIHYSMIPYIVIHNNAEKKKKKL